jgi:hypothetical protein
MSLTSRERSAGMRAKEKLLKSESRQNKPIDKQKVWGCNSPSTCFFSFTRSERVVSAACYTSIMEASFLRTGVSEDRWMVSPDCDE